MFWLIQMIVMSQKSLDVRTYLNTFDGKYVYPLIVVTVLP